MEPGSGSRLVNHFPTVCILVVVVGGAAVRPGNGRLDVRTNCGHVRRVSLGGFEIPIRVFLVIRIGVVGPKFIGEPGSVGHSIR